MKQMQNIRGIVISVLFFLNSSHISVGFSPNLSPRNIPPLGLHASASSHEDASSILDVLVVGAGPTGLTAAAEAKRMGLSVRIIDRKPKRSKHDSRALVVHPRVMELLDIMGDGAVTDRLVERGYKLGGLNLHPGRDKTPIHISSDGFNFGDAVFPFMTWLPQYETESAIEAELERLGGSVEWAKSIQSLSQSNDMVTTVVHTHIHESEKIQEEEIHSRYVIGCDGGRSKTRDSIGIDMDRARSKFYFLFADVHFEKPIQFKEDEVCVFFPPEGPTILFPLPEPNMYRLGAKAPPGVTDKTESSMLDSDALNDILRQRTTITQRCEAGRFAKVFEITHGIANSYRDGRVFLAGDAAHVHSPVGGQGMNYGITDAVNLMWKLAWAERCRQKEAKGNTKTTNLEQKEHHGSVESILQSYAEERKSLGKRLLENTERGTTLVATENVLLQKVRNFFASFLLPRVFPAQVRSLGQLTLPCSGSGSSVLCGEGDASGCITSSGQRMPNLRIIDEDAASGGENGKQDRLYNHLDRVRHTWVVLNPSLEKEEEKAIGSFAEHAKVVYATPSELQDDFPVISPQALKQPQAILVRPDLFVAGVGASVTDGKSRRERCCCLHVVLGLKNEHIKRQKKCQLQKTVSKNNANTMDATIFVLLDSSRLEGAFHKSCCKRFYLILN